MRDGDGDGKCQEEDGKWVPCPPGVATGTRLRNGKPLGQTIADIQQQNPPAKTPQSKKPVAKMSAEERALLQDPRADFNWWWDNFGSPPPDRPDDETDEERRTRMTNFWDAQRAVFEERREIARYERSARPESTQKIEQQEIDDYVAKRRAEAQKQAEKAAAAQQDVSAESKRDARRLLTQLEPSDEDLSFYEEEFEIDNPRPQRIMFETVEEYDNAINNWLAERDFFLEENRPYRGNNTDYLRGEALKMLESAFGHTIVGKSGEIYKPRVLNGVWDSSRQTLVVDGVFVNEAGRSIGRFERTLNFEDAIVTHDLLVVDRAYRSDGIASKFNAMNEVIYREMGFNQIETHGVSSSDFNGASHWPAHGFNWRDDSEKRSFIRMVEAATNSDDDSLFENETERLILKELIEAARNDGWPEKITAGDLIRWKGATQFFKINGADFWFRREI